MYEFKLLEYLFNFITAVRDCVLVSAFVSLVGIPMGITSSAVGIKILQSLLELKSIGQL